MSPTNKDERPCLEGLKLQMLCAALVAASFICFSSGIAHAQGAATDCPTVSIPTPNGRLPVEEKTRFTAEIRGGSGKKFAFRWAVSKGVILSRGDAQEVEVRPGPENSGHSMELFVRVNEVGGFCEAYASTVAEVEAIPIVDPPDGFGAVTPGEVKRSIDDYFIMLQNNPRATGLIYFEHDYKETVGQRRIRLARILTAVRFRNYDISRISFAINSCPIRTETTLSLAMPGSKMPDENGSYEIVAGALMSKHPQLGVPKPNCTCPNRK